MTSVRVLSASTHDSVSLYLDDMPILTGITDASKADVLPENVVLRGYDSESWLVIDGYS